MSVSHILRFVMLCVPLACAPADPFIDPPGEPSETRSLLAYDTNPDSTQARETDSITPPFLGVSLRYGVDTTVSPCVDFYQYVNGDWRSRTVLGGTDNQSRYLEIFSDTRRRAQQRLQVILDSTRLVAATTTDPTLKALGAFYASCSVADTIDHRPMRGPRDTIPPRDSTRAEQCVQRTLMSLGGALGQTFAKDLLASDARVKMQQLVDALRTAIGARLEVNRWMTVEEKTVALHRLKQMRLRIGLPEEMDDYRGLTLSPTDYVQNKATIKAFENAQWIKSIGRRREIWKQSLLTPNARYLGSEHAIEVPALMFMPPFFDAKGDAAANFAGVGYIIGHEIFHGLSLAGELDRLEHTGMKTEIERFQTINSSLGTVDGWSTNGERTFREDVADLGGVLVAYDAWQATVKSQKERPVALVDGFAPDQRFFVGVGRVWRSKWRGMIGGAHASPSARVNAMAMQSPSFARAFGCIETDPMVLAADQRATIW